jgi:cell division protein FtsL
VLSNIRAVCLIAVVIFLYLHRTIMVTKVRLLKGHRSVPVVFGNLTLSTSSLWKSLRTQKLDDVSIPLSGHSLL